MACPKLKTVWTDWIEHLSPQTSRVVDFYFICNIIKINSYVTYHTKLWLFSSGGLWIIHMDFVASKLIFALTLFGSNSADPCVFCTMVAFGRWCPCQLFQHMFSLSVKLRCLIFSAGRRPMFHSNFTSWLQRCFLQLCGNIILI